MYVKNALNRLRALAYAIGVSLVILPGTAVAATFTGEFWSADSTTRNVNQALQVINTGTADATFTSTGIDYPNGGAQTIGGTGTLAAFLGADAASIIGDGLASVQNSVFRFTGYLDALPGRRAFEVAAAGGFRLSVDGRRVAQRGRPGDLNTVTRNQNVQSGDLFFELVYFQNAGDVGITASVDNALITPAPIPLPGTLGLIGTGLIAFGMIAMRQRRRLPLAKGVVSGT